LLKIRYIFLSTIFSLILFSSLLLFHLKFFFEAIIILSLLGIILFVLILKFYKFYHDSLSLLKEENVYINNTVISFFLSPKNEYLRFKVAFEKKIQLYNKKLLEEKSKYSQLLNSVPLPLVLINEQRFILFANNFARDLFPPNFEGSYLHQYFRDPILKNTIEKVKNNLNDYSLNLQIDLNNKNVLFNVKIQPVISEEKKILYYLIIFIDQDSISKSIQERNDFLANASHELKTPLTNIIGISEIIYSDPKAIIENKNFSNNLLVNVKRMQNLIYSLLDLSKVEINKNIIQYKLLSLEKISNSTIDEFKNIQSKKQNIKIFNNLKNRSLRLKTDEKEFKLLFFNILDNAFKYSSSLVKIYLEETTENIEIIFQDNGTGIPKNEINRVTERFYRVKGNEKVEGSGLGLAIVSEIMNNHEGEIKIESEEKIGTKVFLIFKRAIKRPV
jgi:signal transduction histidine kinase